MHWLRRSFIAGFVVMVPLIVSVFAFLWIFEVVDGVMRPLHARLWGREVPGLGLATTLLGILLVGVLATNVFGKRMLQRTEEYLLRLPIFRAIYAPVKQLVAAFSSENELGFKRVVLVEDPERGHSRLPDEGVHAGSGPGSRSACGGLRTDESPVPGRRADLPGRAGVVSGPHDPRRGPYFPHRWDGAFGPGRDLAAERADQERPADHMTHARWKTYLEDIEDGVRGVDEP